MGIARCRCGGVRAPGRSGNSLGPGRSGLVGERLCVGRKGSEAGEVLGDPTAQEGTGQKGGSADGYAGKTRRRTPTLRKTPEEL
jgi:hypothetical protein